MQCYTAYLVPSGSESGGIVLDWESLGLPLKLTIFIQLHRTVYTTCTIQYHREIHNYVCRVAIHRSVMMTERMIDQLTQYAPSGVGYYTYQQNTFYN